MHTVIILLLLCFISAGVYGDDTDVPAPAVLVLHTKTDFEDDLASDSVLGPLTQAHKLLFAQMDQSVNLEFTSLARADRLLQKSQPVCALFRRKTLSRQQAYLFSLPIAFGISHALYQQALSAPIDRRFLNEQGEVMSLSALFDARPHENIVVIANASYGNALDNHIAAINADQKALRYAADVNNSQAKMLAKGRATFALLTPAEEAAHRQQYGPQNFRVYTIEGVPKLAKAHVMCNRQPASRRYIAQINRALEAVYTAPTMHQAYQQTHSESHWGIIRSALQEYSNQARVTSLVEP
ncbi:hypothetical protein [Alteromonas oceanisediminis]|uniref:hypothetical protein n=1 Tax=Alteromonas oceanisediminis TaxID=2836180 RepID=UPI001BD9AE82|nr:hypothetical protein [Alteromonas oceanisediminis]MBT0587664.1 hypothetical protein [Alteromonas oceanisediminis]